VALLELFSATTRAGIIPSDFLHTLLVIYDPILVRFIGPSGKWSGSTC